MQRLCPSQYPSSCVSSSNEINSISMDKPMSINSMNKKGLRRRSRKFKTLITVSVEPLERNRVTGRDAAEGYGEVCLDSPGARGWTNDDLELRALQRFPG